MTTMCNGDTQANCDVGFTHWLFGLGEAVPVCLRSVCGPYSRAPHMLITFYICRNEVDEVETEKAHLYYHSFFHKKTQTGGRKTQVKRNLHNFTTLQEALSGVKERKRLNMSGRGRTLCTQENLRWPLRDALEFEQTPGDMKDRQAWNAAVHEVSNSRTQLPTEHHQTQCHVGPKDNDTVPPCYDLLWIKATCCLHWSSLS